MRRSSTTPLADGDAGPAGAGSPPWWGTAFRRVLWFMAAVTALRILYLAAGDLDLSPDEAHYWEWSRRLDLSYYSKGPLVAYLIRALTAAFGHSAVAIRLGAVALSLVGAAVTFRLGRVAFGDPRVGLLVVIGLQVTPIFWAGSLLMTIDPPFLVCWSGALLLLYRGIVDGSVRAFMMAGVVVGLGLLAKYSMLFVLPGLAVYLLCAPEARRWLRHPAPYAMAAIALAVVIPVIAWNTQHGWVTARHVASQGRGGGLTAKTLVEFVASQVGVLTPLIAGILAWAAWYGLREGLVRRREPYRFLMAFAAPVLAFYLLLSLQGKVQANWAAAAYPPLALVAGGALLERRGRLGPEARRAQTGLMLASASLALLVTIVGHAPDLVGLRPGLDPTVRLRGWRDLGQAVSAMRAEMPVPDRTFLMSDRYQITSELAFYASGNPPAYNVNLGRRLNQYDFWEGPESRLGWDALYVQEDLGRLDERVIAAFERIEGPQRVEVRRRGRVVRTFAVYRGYGWRGMGAPFGPVQY